MVVQPLAMTQPESDRSTSDNQRRHSDVAFLWDLLDQVKDPEIPVLSLWDLGVLRDIQMEGEEVVITITPTYCGCPALETMKADITTVLNENGYANVMVKTVLAPAWSSEWIRPRGRSQLLAYGIAPPRLLSAQPNDRNASQGHDANSNMNIIPVTNFELDDQVPCPGCQSHQTRLISEFGSTACKALYQCEFCLEPFDYFKPI